MKRLSLRQALETHQLEAFIRQEEERGIGSSNKADFDAAVAAIAKQPRSEDQTSRSASRGGSRGK